MAFALAATGSAVLAAPALADFSGQTILGPLVPGSNIVGDNTFSSNDNDGWTSGPFPVFDIWDGGDDVYALNWPGGDMNILLNSLDGFSDPDLFLYTPGNLDESTLDSIRGGIDSVTMLGAAPGTYYVLIDTVSGFEGEYRLQVSAVPAPGALALLAVAGLVSRRRRPRD